MAAEEEELELACRRRAPVAAGAALRCLAEAFSGSITWTSSVGHKERPAAWRHFHAEAAWAHERGGGVGKAVLATRVTIAVLGHDQTGLKVLSSARWFWCNPGAERVKLSATTIGW